MKGEKHYLVELQPGFSYEFHRSILIHEIAHVLAGLDKIHQDPWGVAYARCFRAVFGA